MLRRTLAILAFVSIAAIAFAHGTDKHVLGTVTKITDTEITVESQTKDVQVVKIAPDTSFVKSGASATIKDLKVGDRVVIHAKPVGSDLIAHEVRFGKMPTAAAGSAATKPQ
ncbi:MAG TPA: DUF5666 domain-containing protein [Terriglobales bacterium]|nr:DUF5666 domain-containing protein [Terriglobales bacterium]